MVWIGGLERGCVSTIACGLLRKIGGLRRWYGQVVWIDYPTGGLREDKFDRDAEGGLAHGASLTAGGGGAGMICPNMLVNGK